MIYNLDNYNIELYNEFLINLKKHNIEYNEYVNTKDYKFYLETSEYPFILNYSKIQNASNMFLISKVKSVNQQDDYKFLRKRISNSKDNLNLCINDAYDFFLNSKINYYYFIHIQNKEASELLSKQIGRLYYFGSYLNNRYKIYLTNNQYLTNFIKIDDILASDSNIFTAELQLNYEIFNLKDRLKKFSQTPYRENGKTVLPKYLADFFKSNKSASGKNKS